MVKNDVRCRSSRSDLELTFSHIDYKLLFGEHAVNNELQFGEVQYFAYDSSKFNSYEESVASSQQTYRSSSIYAFAFPLVDGAGIDENSFEQVIWAHKNYNTWTRKGPKQLKLVIPEHLKDESIKKINARKILPSLGYFRYDGSITHPDCNEGVIWTVFMDKILISKNQAGYIKALRDYNPQVINNNRNVQAINGRKIECYWGTHKTSLAKPFMRPPKTTLPPQPLRPWSTEPYRPVPFKMTTTTTTPRPTTGAVTKESPRVLQ